MAQEAARTATGGEPPTRPARAAAVLVPVLGVRRRGGLGELVGQVRRTGGRDRLLLAGIAVVMAVTPAVTAVGAVLFLHDHLDRWRIASEVLAVTGVVLVNASVGVASGSGGRLLLWFPGMPRVAGSTAAAVRSGATVH